MGKLNNPARFETQLGGRTLSLETNRLAKQADGSVLISYGETVMLVTAVSDKEPRPMGFLPLTIEFQEKFYASGRIPGGFFKKEARPTEWATLNARMVDRPIRPLFPKGYECPTQVVLTLLSYDDVNDVETLTSMGASAALCLSDIPFTTPIASVRVGRIEGTFKVNPTPDELDVSDVNVLVSGSEESIVMVEGDTKNVSEDDFLEGVYFAHEEIKKLIELQKEMIAAHGKPKREYNPPVRDEELFSAVKGFILEDVAACYKIQTKIERYAALDVAKKKLKEHFADKIEADDTLSKKISECFGDVKRDYARELTLKGSRIDGRAYEDVRQIEIEAGWLPRTHGSSLFTRGETQAAVTITLGTGLDEQMLDGVKGKSFKKFLLHYNFPPYCVGETGRFGGNSRREIGHGNLAERAIRQMLPSEDEFAYTIRVVSEVLESNGSSSMATVCGGSLALMDAGVPIKKAVAGIAMGLIQEGDQTCILSDILGDEDHLGDMDFKVCGTDEGLTAVQMDIKIKGISRDLMKKALMQAREGRMHILSKMNEALKDAREEVSLYAPKIIQVQVPVDKIREVIGAGGKIIKGLQAETGCVIEINDDGIVTISHTDPKAIASAKEKVEAIVEEPEIGKVYTGIVDKIVDFGAFVKILSNSSGLVHVSEIDNKRVEKVTDYFNEGDEIQVKVLDIDRQGKVRLSRKALLPADS